MLPPLVSVSAEPTTIPFTPVGPTASELDPAIRTLPPDGNVMVSGDLDSASTVIAPRATDKDPSAATVNSAGPTNDTIEPSSSLICTVPPSDR